MTQSGNPELRDMIDYLLARDSNNTTRWCAETCDLPLWYLIDRVEHLMVDAFISKVAIGPNARSEA